MAFKGDQRRLHFAPIQSRMAWISQRGVNIPAIVRRAGIAINLAVIELGLRLQSVGHHTGDGY